MKGGREGGRKENKMVIICDKGNEARGLGATRKWHPHQRRQDEDRGSASDVVTNQGITRQKLGEAKKDSSPEPVEGASPASSDFRLSASRNNSGRKNWPGSSSSRAAGKSHT